MQIPNDECIAESVADPISPSDWDKEESGGKFQSLYVITKAASGTAPKLYLADGDNQQQSGRKTAFSEKFYTKSTTH